MRSLLLRGGSVVQADGVVRADVLCMDGSIVACGLLDRESHAKEIIPASGMLLFPGLIDCHVHFREPGLTQKATMASEAQAARAGGVTTVCDMPNTIPPTVTLEALREKVRIAQGIPDCDIRFFFGITESRNLIALRKLWVLTNPAIADLRRRCCGVKLYVDHSTGNQGADASVIEEAMELCGRLRIPVVAHCEDPAINRRAAAGVDAHGSVSLHSRMRPPESEEAAVARMIGLARRYGTHLHIAHVSTSLALDRVREAKQEGLAVTCEVAPHHLFLTEEDYAVLGTLGKMNPPLRSVSHRDALWAGIGDGTVDCIATDHAPHTLQEKQTAHPLDAPSGVPGVETMLPLLLTVASGGWPHPRSERPATCRLKPEDIVRLCFAHPNRMFALGKTGITEGSSDPMVMVDPRKSWTLTETVLHSACRWTPYEGWSVRGAVVRVF